MLCSLWISAKEFVSIVWLPILLVAFAVDRETSPRIFWVLAAITTTAFVLYFIISVVLTWVHFCRTEDELQEFCKMPLRERARIIGKFLGT